VTEPEPQQATWSFPVEASHIMLFARAIGDQNPVYSDAAYAQGTPCGGIIAPPTFVTAQFHFDPAFTLRPMPGTPWLGSGRTPSGLTDRGTGRVGVGSMHAEQHYHYHRSIRPGDVLTQTRRPGTEWQKTGRRGGTLTFTDRYIDWRDQTGALVVTERGVSVKPSKTVRGEEG
jgi:acyl dehydratase